MEHKTLILTVLITVHDKGGHVGAFKMYRTLKGFYYWQNSKGSIENHISTCINVISKTLDLCATWKKHHLNVCLSI